MNFSAPFIRRPVATMLLAMAILLSGMVAFTQLPVAPLPRVDFPTIQVNAGLPGASPETMASSVAAPLERRFGRIAGLTEMTSASGLGQTSLSLQFDLDRDVDSAARDVQAAINAAGGDLPPNMPARPRFGKVNPGDTPILILSLTSQTLPLAEVFETAASILAQKISQVSGVGQVFAGGGQQPAVRVQADPEALAGVGLSLADVRGVLVQATLNEPKGAVGSGGGERSAVVAANDQLLRAADYQPLIVSYKNGAAVRLSDVAQVKDDVENNRVAAWSSGKRAVLLIIRRQPGANIIEVIERIKALLPQLSRSISPAITIEVALDRSQTIRASVHEVEMTLLLSLVLVVMVVFLFLRSARATAIPSVAMPLSIIGTFGAMYLCGYSLNNLSLMALTISTGFVVDDAIVVTENISRYIEAGVEPFEAALKGASQIGFTIISITVSLLAVFIPILLMGGVIGRLFREFAVTLSFAVGFSALVSLTLTPMMCARMLRHEKAGAKQGLLVRILERGFERLQNLYDRGLRFVLRHQVLTLLVALGTVGLSVFLYIVVPKGLFPQQDTGQIQGFTEASQDISFPAMRDRQERVNNVVMADPDVGHMMAFTGGGPGAALNTGTMFVELKRPPARKSTADQVINRLRPKLAKIEGIRLFLQASQDVRIGARFSRTQYQYTLQDANLEELNTFSPRVLEKLRGLKELRDVASDQQTAGLQLNLDIDRDTASRMGVSTSAIDDALYDAFGQRQVAVMYTQLNQYRVVLEVKPELQTGPDALNHLYVRGAGGLLPLRSLVHIKPTSTSLSVNHQGQFPSVTMSFNTAPGVALGPAVDAIHRVERELGLPASVRATFQGSAQAFSASLASQPALILAALLVVYIVLGMLYESFIHPITILSTLPSAGVGALLALLLFRTEFSIIALIGIVLLIGIVKKNAIMMIDFALEVQRDKGLSPREAIHEACLMRFRPILMTTMAALLGGLPLALGRGVGSELRTPLGISIVGGLLISQLLTLFTTPVVYLLLSRISHRKSRQVPAKSLAPNGGELAVGK